jgi:AhpD family alkylhydroperoxidase
MTPAKVELKPRIDIMKVAPDGLRPVQALEAYVHHHTALEPALLELVRLRASQINGCAYCLDMHSKDARLAGETEQRIYGLSAWKEAPYYSERERAALAWTEAVTQIAWDHAPDEAYQAARAVFSEKELVDLTLAIAVINTWNRLAISFRAVPGSYQPRPEK